ncbi:hypothetical protein ACFVZ3_17490 [Kitasatospora purpeofusca]|uniref:hypothetical protein n=1 Tax=Kitasatospora purpeofusca TaxID=67352 RepID=UPI0036B8841A
MTVTPDPLCLPARRRRHARLILGLTTLIGACAEAAGEVYRPIAQAPAGREAVEVTRWPVVQVSGTAASLLDMARAEDDARWPGAVAQERDATRRTYAARCAVATAQALLDPAESGAGVPLPTVEQAAAMQLAGAGDEVAACWREDPQEAVALVSDLVAGGELGVDEVLDQAVDSAVLAGLMALQAARAETDPTMTAELCLAAVPHLVLAVALASADLD